MVPVLRVMDNRKKPLRQNRETGADVIEEKNLQVDGDPEEAGDQAVGVDREKIANIMRNCSKKLLTP